MRSYFIHIKDGIFCLSHHLIKCLHYPSFKSKYEIIMGFPGGSVVKNYPTHAGDVGSIPGSGRVPGEGNGSPLQYSCLRNPTDKRAWQATVHSVARARPSLARYHEASSSRRGCPACGARSASATHCADTSARKSCFEAMAAVTLGLQACATRRRSGGY